MSFIKKLGDQVNVLGKKSGEMLEVTKLKLSRSKLEKEAEEKTLALGHRFYEEYLKGKVEDKEMVALCEAIDRVKAEIGQVDEQIEAAQNKDAKGHAETSAPQAEEVVGGSDKPKISEAPKAAEVVGAPEEPAVQEIPESAEVVGAGIVEAPKAKYCSNCGERAEAGAKFCGNCGNKME